MDSAPSMDTVIQALNVLYRQPDAAGKEKASAYLNDMQKSVYAWEIANQLLQNNEDLESCYFAAHTMRTKIQLSFAELPPASHQTFRDSLLNHCMKVNRETPNAIATQLCLALSDLILQMSSWRNAASQLIQQFGGNDQNWTFLLEVLSVIPEEVDNKLLRLGTNRTEEIRQDLISSSQMLVQLLTVVLDGSSSNEKLQAKVFQCLGSWLILDVIPQQHLIASKLLSLVFLALANINCPESVHTEAANCISSALYPGEDLERNLQISQRLFEGIMGLLGPYQQAASAQKVDKVGNYCRVFTQMAECFLDSMIATPNQGFGDLRTVDIILTCMDYPDFSVADITFTFWNELSDVLYEVSKPPLNAAFRPYIERLVLALSKHCRYPPTQTDVQSENNDFADFRAQAFELVRDFEPCLRASGVITQMFELMSAAGANASWEVLESALFIMLAVAKHVEPTDDTVVPHILPTLLGIPASAHVAVRYTNIKLVGSLCYWLNAHHQYLEPVMKFLLENVQQAKLSGASAVAIKRLCVVCSPAMSAHLPSLLQLAQSVDHIPLSNASVNWLIEGVSAVLGKTSGGLLADNFRQLCFMQLEPLNQMIDNQTQPVVRGKKDTDPAVWLDRLSAIFRAIDLSVAPGHAHPCQPVIEQLWPVLAKTAQKYSSDMEATERLFRCIRYALRCLGKHRSSAIFNPVLNQVVEIYRLHHHTCCLYLGSVLVDEYGDEPGFIPLLLEMLQALCAPTFQILQAADGMRNNPDVVDDLYRLAQKFIRRCAVPFLRSDCLSPMLRVAIAGLSLEHREAHESVTLFLLYLVRAARDNSDSHDFATRRQLVRSVVQDVGPSLVAGVLKACLFDIPRSMICHSTEVFYELLSTDRALTLHWFEAALKALPNQTPGGTVRATAQQLSDFHAAISSVDDAGKVDDLFCEFSRLYH